MGAPKIVLLDEPGAGLNDAETARLRHLLTRIPKEFDVQVVLIDHDANSSQPLARKHWSSILVGYWLWGPLGKCSTTRTSGAPIWEQRDVSEFSLQVENVTVERDGREVIRNLSLVVAPGEIVALLGANRAGKSSLIATMGGALSPKSG